MLARRKRTASPRTLQAERGQVPTSDTLAALSAAGTTVHSGASNLPDAGGLFGLEHSGAFGAFIKRWLFRAALVGATFCLVGAVVWLQFKVGQDFSAYSRTQKAIQWAELVWLAPVPLALVLWLGWFVFAEPALPGFSDVPSLSTGEQSPSVPVRLVFRFVTRGDNVEVLRQSVASVRTAFAVYPHRAGPHAIEVVTEQPLDLGDDVRVVVVPPDYQTPHRSRFKARALTYLHLQSPPRPQDWHIYLDEESGVSAYVVAGVYEFISRACRRSPSPHIIGQGAILYQGGHWFFRGADALRTADDFGRFRVQYALGVPLFGIHGSYIVTNARAAQELSFDVGYDNSITEDAAWGLRAWAKGWRFGWVKGCLHEQPPQHAYDFIRQRARWLSGIRKVLRDREVPLRYRLSLGIFGALWQISFLPFLVAAAGLIFHVIPFAWMRLPADFAWAVFVLAYGLGADTQAKYSTLNSDGTFQQRPRVRRVIARLIAWTMVVNYIWFALLEAASIVYSILPSQGFFVIQKPRLGLMSRPGEAEESLPVQPANARDREEIGTHPRLPAVPRGGEARDERRLAHRVDGAPTEPLAREALPGMTPAGVRDAHGRLPGARFGEDDTLIDR